eukprot:jgi/Mesvir1/17971/Mv09863-RA.1
MDALGWFHLIWEREEWDKIAEATNVYIESKQMPDNVGDITARETGILPVTQRDHASACRRQLGKDTGGAREEVPCPEAMLRYNCIYKCVDQFDFLLQRARGTSRGGPAASSTSGTAARPWARSSVSTIVRMAYCLQKLALGKDAMDHRCS